MRADTHLGQLLGIRYPIVQAPMAGGHVTTDLVVAVCEAGGLGVIAGAMLSPDALREEIRAVRARTERPFGVNIFAPVERGEATPDATAAVNELLAPFRADAGL